MVDPHNTIFPTQSPVKQLDSETQSPPAPMSNREHEHYSSRILSKLNPLLSAKETADKVYSNGYFERHYSDADKKLKKLLHRRVMAAWSNSLVEASEDSVERDDKSNLGHYQHAFFGRQIGRDVADSTRQIASTTKDVADSTRQIASVTNDTNSLLKSVEASTRKFESALQTLNREPRDVSPRRITISLNLGEA